jgi:ribosomal protein S6--L-glutamate ligase
MVELDESYRETAVRAAQIMGLRVAGVDMLEGVRWTADHGSQFLTRPGGNRDLHAAGHCRRDYRLYGRTGQFPEIDIRQRLTVSRGYGVTEIHIPGGLGVYWQDH